MRPLTDRERDVGILISQGLTNEEIANRLLISIRTVRYFSDQVKLKLGVEHRRQIGQKMRDLDLM